MSDSDEESRWTRNRRMRAAYAAGREQGGSDESESSASSDEDEPRPQRRRVAESSDTSDSQEEPDEGGESEDEEEEIVEEEEAEEQLIAEQASEDDDRDGPDQNLEQGAPDQAQGGDLLSDEELVDGSESGEDTNSSNSEASSSSEGDSEEDTEDEEEDDEGAEDQANAAEDAPLYDGARVSQMESIIMILTFALTFTLSGQCLARLLEIIELHCPRVNRCVTTLFKFKKIFKDIGRGILKQHFFCQRCYSPLKFKDSVCIRCRDLTDVAFFIEIPILSQLQRMFLRPGFLENLSYRFNRQKEHEHNFEDIYDGNLYKEQMGNNGFLNNRFNISFMWYTDGISVFKSSKFSVWPIFFVLNELSYKLRTQKENIILAGLWFGKTKPKPNLFLRPFSKTLATFYDEGFLLNVPEGPPVRVKGLLLCGTCDLQAKGLFLKMKSSNGYYGCHKCHSSGMRVPAGRTTVHVHQYIPPEQIRLRNNDNIQALARSKQLGYQGLSRLSLLMPSMIRGTAIDIMHMVFIGITKLLAKFWFDTKFSNEPFSCSAVVDEINERLSNIKPPSFVQRFTRTLNDLKLWKALEYKLWLFYYSLAVMNGFLERVYLEHHLKLVSAISLLCQESISRDQIDSAEVLLHEYVRDFQALYSLRFMGMNVHLLLHLPDMVRDLGPLWVYSCFFFEDLNGQLAKLIHGPHQVGLQICSSASLFLSLKTKINCLDPASLAKKFCVSLKSANHRIAEHINEKTKILGRTAFDISVSEATVRLIQDQYNVAHGHFQVFFSLKKSGVTFSCESKVTSQKRCSMFAEFLYNGYPVLGKIKEFVRFSLCDCDSVCLCVPAQYYCIVQKYERIPWFAHHVQNVRIAYLTAVQSTEDMLVIPCSNIKSICFYINVNNIHYVATPINSLEYE